MTSQPVRNKPARTPNPTDKILGCFSRIEPSEPLDHAIRYLNTWNGTDKVLMVTQYSSKLLIVLLNLQYAIRKRLILLKARKPSNVVERVTKLSSLIGDARMLFRIWGILPILKWMISLERAPPPTRLLHNIERIQGWSMLLYCPMEAVAYLSSHGILPIAATNQNKLWLWSCRLWALYVGLQLLHLVEDNRLLRLRARALERSRGHPIPHSIQLITESNPNQEKVVNQDQQQAITRSMWDELDDRKTAILNELWVNLGYLPLTLHWSAPNGLMGPGWVGLFGTIAGIAGLRSGWKASSTPHPPPLPTYH